MVQANWVGRTASLLLAAVAAAACSDRLEEPLASVAAASSLMPAPPSAVLPISFGGQSATVWPFTGRNFVDAADPINVVFVGETDPLALRAALLALDGNRTAFGLPAGAPFDCRWADAIGGVQTAYSGEGGWTGSAVQLDCGGYGPLRFHLRLFEAGDWSLGGAHFEVLIPGTADHEVLSWELAEQVVVVDLMRSGLLDPNAPLGATDPITPAPAYRAINPFVYNGLPAALIAALGTPAPPVAAPVPIPNDGRATVLNVAGAVAPAAEFTTADFVLQYDQTVPRPFCSTGPQDFVHVRGPVTLRQTVHVSEGGVYTASAHISGSLEISIPGSQMLPREARVDRQLHAIIDPAGPFVTDRFRQFLMPRADEAPQSSHARLQVGPGGGVYTLDVRCH